jgi:hypothetical protein
MEARVKKPLECLLLLMQKFVNIYLGLEVGRLSINKLILYLELGSRDP